MMRFTAERIISKEELQERLAGGRLRTASSDAEESDRAP